MTGPRKKKPEEVAVQAEAVKRPRGRPRKVPAAIVDAAVAAAVDSQRQVLATVEALPVEVPLVSEGGAKPEAGIPADSVLLAIHVTPEVYVYLQNLCAMSEESAQLSPSEIVEDLVENWYHVGGADFLPAGEEEAAVYEPSATRLEDEYDPDYEEALIALTSPAATKSFAPC